MSANVSLPVTGRACGYCNMCEVTSLQSLFLYFLLLLSLCLICLYPSVILSLSLPLPLSLPLSLSLSVCISLSLSLCPSLQSCTGSAGASRVEQCAAFNTQEFMGRLYDWEPFTEGERERGMKRESEEEREQGIDAGIDRWREGGRE